MKNLKNQKGITLVALVVTIIVLLILAGVSLSLVAGSNGIMTKATSASDSSVTATAREQTELLLSQLSTDYYDQRYVQLDNTAQNQSGGQYIAYQINTSTNNAESTAGKGMRTSSNKFTVTVYNTLPTELKYLDGSNVTMTTNDVFKYAPTGSTWTEETTASKFVIIQVDGDSLQGVGTAKGSIYAILSADGQITHWFDANGEELKN